METWEFNFTSIQIAYSILSFFSSIYFPNSLLLLCTEKIYDITWAY